MVLIGCLVVLHEVEGYKRIYGVLYSTIVARVSHISCVGQVLVSDQT